MSVGKESKNIALITAGSAVVALGIVLFLVPNKIATGGTPGLAILLNHLTGLTTGSLMVLVNIPLLLFGSQYLGRSFGARTVLAIIFISGFVDLFSIVLKLSAVSNSLLLATLYGGIIIGVGVGLILKGNASAGGTTIIVRVVSAKFGIKPGRVLMTLDMLIVIASGIVFRNTEQALWSLISIYVTAKAVDMILTGAPSEKVVHIVSQKMDELSRRIAEHLGSHGTIVSGKGIVRGEQKTMIFLVVEARRITVLRDLICEIDPEAFMVVMDAAEMLGRGHQGVG